MPGAVATDFSVGMLAAAKTGRALPRVAGDAMRLPFADESFDAVTISFGLRNVEDPAAALRRVRQSGPPRRAAAGLRVLPAPARADPLGVRLVPANGLPLLAGRVSSNPEAYTYLRRPSTPGPTSRLWPG